MIKPTAAATRAKSKAMPKTIDDYLAAVPEEDRAALAKLRKTIKAAAPKATEVISYQIPSFKHHGLLVGFAAYRNHCSFFLMSTRLMSVLKGELLRYETTKSAIHFTAGKPLPAALVKKIVKARIDENEARKKR